jgi:hypothetical protein
MALDFNWEGYLHHNVDLTFQEFVHHFGTNSTRMLQIENSIQFFRIFRGCGCKIVYVDGSFVSKKKIPEDIDLCFDLSDVDPNELTKGFPEFFDINAIGTTHRDLHCHILHFDKEDKSLFTMLQYDRQGNPKGLVKLNILEILTSYDKKRKTI